MSLEACVLPGRCYRRMIPSCGPSFRPARSPSSSPTSRARQRSGVLRLLSRARARAIEKVRLRHPIRWRSEARSPFRGAPTRERPPLSRAHARARACARESGGRSPVGAPRAGSEPRIANGWGGVAVPFIARARARERSGRRLPSVVEPSTSVKRKVTVPFMTG